MEAPALTTEIPFTLPRGHVAADGSVHRTGRMRLARARDELAVLRDPAVRNDQAYASVLLLARVVTELGDVPVTPDVIEDLFAADFDHLVSMFERLNACEHVGTIECPECSHVVEVDLSEIADGRLGK